MSSGVDYKPTPRGKAGNLILRVYSDGKHCGHICSVAGGYQYRPKNSNMRGAVHPTIADVKKELEG